MSQLAQAVEKAVRELHAKARHRRRRTMNEDDAIDAVIGTHDEPGAVTEPATTDVEGADEMAKKATTTATKKKAQKLRTLKKSATAKATPTRATKTAKGTSATLPPADELQLAPDGVTAVGNKYGYVQLEFTSGHHVRLLPASFSADESQRVSSCLAQWLKQHLR